MIEALQVHVLADHYVVKVRFAPDTKKLDKRQVRKLVNLALAEVVYGTEEPERVESGGGRGFWHNGRLEELVIERHA